MRWWRCSTEWRKKKRRRQKKKKNEDRDFLNRFHGCDLREIDPVSFIWKTCPKYLQNISWVRNVTHKWSCTSSQTSRGPSVQHGILSGTILCLLTRAPIPWHTPAFIFLLNINLEIVFTRFVYIRVTRGVRHFVGQSIPRFRVDVLCNFFFVVAYINDASVMLTCYTKIWTNFVWPTKWWLRCESQETWCHSKSLCRDTTWDFTLWKSNCCCVRGVENFKFSASN